MAFAAFSIDVFDDHPLNGGEADGQLLRHAFLAHDFAAQDLNLTGSTCKIARASVDGHHRDRFPGLKHIQVMAKGAIGGVHHGLKFSVAKPRTGFKGRENTTAQRMLVARGTG